MLRLLVVWLINALALLTVAYVMPSIRVDSFTAALIYALWPRNGRDFRRASRLPLKEKEDGDDRPLA